MAGGSGAFVHEGCICDGTCGITDYITDECFVCNDCENACFCDDCVHAHRFKTGHTTYRRDKTNGDSSDSDSELSPVFSNDSASTAATSVSSPPTSPTEGPSGSHLDKLPMQDRFSAAKYAAWLRGLSDSALQQEEKRTSLLRTSANAWIVANFVATPFTAPATGLASLGVHGAHIAYKTGRSLHYSKNWDLCRAEMEKREVEALARRRRDYAKAFGGTVLRGASSLFN